MSRIERDRVNALAPDTQAAYDHHWSLWVEFNAHSPVWECDEAKLARFVDWLVYVKHWQAKSARTAMGGLTTCLRLN